MINPIFEGVRPLCRDVHSAIVMMATAAARGCFACVTEEWFPVKKKLLRPCIALTKAVQDKGDVAVELSVDVDCPTFDKVLLFLEAEALGRAHEFNVDINLADDLLQAARTLGCQPLEDVCLRLLGDFESRIREYTFSEVKEYVCPVIDSLPCVDGQ